MCYAMNGVCKEFIGSLSEDYRTYFNCSRTDPNGSLKLSNETSSCYLLVTSLPSTGVQTVQVISSLYSRSTLHPPLPFSAPQSCTMLAFTKHEVTMLQSTSLQIVKHTIRCFLLSPVKFVILLFQKRYLILPPPFTRSPSLLSRPLLPATLLSLLPLLTNFNK